MAVDAKFYELSSTGYGSTFEKEYEKDTGDVYGSQTVDTGYSFDSSRKKLFDKLVYKNGITCLDNSPYFARYYIGQSADIPSYIVPSPMMNGGGTFRMWSDQDDDGKEFQVTIPSMNVEWFNQEYEGYDIPGGYKLQLNNDDKTLDGSNILVAFNGFVYHRFGKLSDDTAQMFELNNGKPCWDLDINTESLKMPVFSRSFLDEKVSLDFGIPKILYTPPQVYPEGETIYENCWKRYLTDRYSPDTKVVKVKVDFTGMQVNAESLRKFYFFDGQIWQLNKIINHSITTNDLTECEFVRVQSIDNYR